MAKICLGRPNHIVIGSVRDDTTPAVKELKEHTRAEETKLLLVHIESTSPEDPAKAVAAVEAAGIDHVDTIIANAGASPFPVLPIDEVSNADLLWAYQTNAAGPLGLFQAFKPLLQKSKSPKWASITSTGGSISLISPMHSYIAAAYGMSKAAQNWMTQYVSDVLCPTGPAKRMIGA
jgi:NAD(P)-dependent dehydrogenase (short-subunit alcohol dehydrogenase family)